jgi:phosphoribosylanthranilate isomerase
LTQIKICGITNLEDARCAAEAGADFLGFILYRKSPRYIAPERIAAIIGAIREEYGPRPRGVGVFVDEPIADLRRALAGALPTRVPERRDLAATAGRRL